MKAWQIERFGLDGLKLKEITKSSDLGDNDVRVKLKAVSLNYRDYMTVMGIYNPRQPLPIVPCSDGAGIVVETGKNVKDFKIEDRVLLTFFQNGKTLGGPLDGTLKEEIVIDAEGLVKMPSHLSFIEGACLPCAALTAFNAIYSNNSLNPGDFVLIEGTGGVSLFALQFANTLNLKTIVLTSSKEKEYKLKDLNPSFIINYKENIDWLNTIKDITQNQGVSLAVEVAGKTTILNALKSLKKGGKLSLIGVLTGSEAQIDLRVILMNSLKIEGIFVGPKPLFLSMNRVLEHSKIKPIIDKVFDFNDAKEAFLYLESQKHFGKICICM